MKKTEENKNENCKNEKNEISRNRNRENCAVEHESESSAEQKTSSRQKNKKTKTKQKPDISRRMSCIPSSTLGSSGGRKPWMMLTSWHTVKKEFTRLRV
jgi:hypothetical protein